MYLGPRPPARSPQIEHPGGGYVLAPPRDSRARGRPKLRPRLGTGFWKTTNCTPAGSTRPNVAGGPVALPSVGWAPARPSGAHKAPKRPLEDLDRLLGLQREQEVQGLLGRPALNEEVGEPRGEPVGWANDLVARLHEGLRPHDPVPLHELPQGLQVACGAGPLRVDVAVGHGSQGRLRDRRARGDAQGREEGLLHELHSPGPPVALVDLAASHAGVHLDELRARARVLALHVEDSGSEAHCLHDVHGEVP
mmetsp:Transcript_72131/g.188111  ORF Transcript_72131/g.188111 Transcript_72131/m.188111 type:complete len:251 (+) Transcript_72131:118-870(+)